VKNLLRSIWRICLISGNKKLGVVLLTLFIGLILELISFALLLPLLRLLLSPESLPSAIESKIESLGVAVRLFVFSLVAVLIFLSKGLFLSAINWNLSRFLAGIEIAAQSQLVNIFTWQTYESYLQKAKAYYFRTMLSAAEICKDVVEPSLLLISNFATVLIGIFILALINPLILVSFLCLSISFFVFSKFIFDINQESRGNEVFALLQVRIRKLQNLFEDKKIVTLTNSGSFLRDEFNAIATNISNLNSKTRLVSTSYFLCLELIAVTQIIVATLILTSSKMSEYEITLTLGAVSIVLIKILIAINRLQIAFNSILNNKAFIVEFEQVLSQRFEHIRPSREVVNLGFEQSIKFVDVSYSYPKSQKFALKQVNFEVCKGEVVGVIGKSGSGKSTFADLIVGFLTPTTGTIRIDGVDLHGCLHKWRTMVGYVSFQTLILDKTIRENIAFGVPNSDIDCEALERAVEISGSSDLVKSFSRGLDTQLGELDQRLSNGQTQRIGIARALYSNPQVLVFDESTNGIDFESEMRIFEAITNFSPPKTIFCISHRESMLKYCDRIFSITNGVLTEQT